MQNTAYGLRISDWSSDVCSSDPIRAIEDRVRTLGIDCHYETRTAYTFARDQGMRSALHEEVDAAVEAGLHARFTRWERRREGQECVSTCRSRVSPCTYK